MDTQRYVKPELEDRPLYFIQGYIDRKFEGDPLSWKEADPVVILDKLKAEGNDITNRLSAKVHILKFIQEHGVQDLLEDPIRTIYSVEVLNNIDSVFVDPEFIPHITALEMAYFIQQMKALGALSNPENAPYEFKKVCAFILNNEGFYEPPFPFSFLTKQDIYMFHKGEELPETDKEVQANKQKAIDTYLRLMASLDK